MCQKGKLYTKLSLANKINQKLGRFILKIYDFFFAQNVQIIKRIYQAVCMYTEKQFSTQSNQIGQFSVIKVPCQ